MYLFSAGERSGDRSLLSRAGSSKALWVRPLCRAATAEDCLMMEKWWGGLDEGVTEHRRSAVYLWKDIHLNLYLRLAVDFCCLAQIKRVPFSCIIVVSCWTYIFVCRCFKAEVQVSPGPGSVIGRKRLFSRVWVLLGTVQRCPNPNPEWKDPSGWWWCI